MMRKFRHIKKIIRNSSHNLSNLRIGIIRIPQPLKVVKCILPHIRLYIYAHHMSHIRHKILGRRIYQTQDKIQRR